MTSLDLEQILSEIKQLQNELSAEENVLDKANKDRALLQKTLQDKQRGLDVLRKRRLEQEEEKFELWRELREQQEKIRKHLIADNSEDKIKLLIHEQHDFIKLELERIQQEAEAIRSALGDAKKEVQLHLSDKGKIEREVKENNEQDSLDQLLSNIDNLNFSMGNLEQREQKLIEQERALKGQSLSSNVLTYIPSKLQEFRERETELKKAIEEDSEDSIKTEQQKDIELQEQKIKTIQAHIEEKTQIIVQSKQKEEELWEKLGELEEKVRLHLPVTKQEQEELNNQYSNYNARAEDIKVPLLRQIEINKLKHTLKEQKEKYEDAQLEVENLKKRLEDFNSSRTEENSKNLELIEELQKKIKELSEEKNQQQASILNNRSLADELSELGERCSTLSPHMEKITQEKDALGAELKMVIHQLQLAQEELDRARQSLTSSDAELLQIKELYKKDSDRLKKTQNQLEEKQQQLVKEQEKTKEESSKVQQLEVRLERSKEEKDNLKIVYDAQLQAIKQLKEATQEPEALTIQLSQLQSEQQKKQQELENTQQELGKLQEKLLEAQEKLKAENKKFKNLEVDLSQVTQEKENLKIKFEKQEQEVEDLTSQLKKTSVKLQEGTRQLSQLTSQLEVEQKSRKNIQIENTNLQAQLEREKNEQNQLKTLSVEQKSKDKGLATKQVGVIEGLLQKPVKVTKDQSRKHPEEELSRRTDLETKNSEVLRELPPLKIKPKVHNAETQTGELANKGSTSINIEDGQMVNNSMLPGGVSANITKIIVHEPTVAAVAEGQPVDKILVQHKAKTNIYDDREEDKILQAFKKLSREQLHPIGVRLNIDPTVSFTQVVHEHANELSKILHNKEVLQEIGNIERQLYNDIHKKFADEYKEIRWQGEGSGKRFSLQQNGKEVATISEQKLNNDNESAKYITSEGEKIENARMVDIPLSIDMKGTCHMSFVVQDLNGHNISKKDAVYLTVHYKDGKLVHLTKPTEIFSCSDEDNSPLYLRSNGKTYTLPVNKGTLEQLEKEVIQNGGEYIGIIKNVQGSIKINARGALRSQGDNLADIALFNSASQLLKAKVVLDDSINKKKGNFPNSTVGAGARTL